MKNEERLIAMLDGVMRKSLDWRLIKDRPMLEHKQLPIVVSRDSIWVDGVEFRVPMLGLGRFVRNWLPETVQRLREVQRERVLKDLAVRIQVYNEAQEAKRGE